MGTARVEVADQAPLARLCKQRLLFVTLWRVTDRFILLGSVDTSHKNLPLTAHHPSRRSQINDFEDLANMVAIPACWYFREEISLPRDNFVLDASLLRKERGGSL